VEGGRVLLWGHPGRACEGKGRKITIGNRAGELLGRSSSARRKITPFKSAEELEEAAGDWFVRAPQKKKTGGGGGVNDFVCGRYDQKLKGRKKLGFCGS